VGGVRSGQPEVEATWPPQCHKEDRYSIRQAPQRGKINATDTVLWKLLHQPSDAGQHPPRLLDPRSPDLIGLKFGYVAKTVGRTFQ